MTAILDKIRVQNALVAAAMAGAFYPVVYDPTTHLASVGVAPVSPSEALANEISSTFGPATLNRLRDKRERLVWNFQLVLKFATEVCLESFEASVVDTPIILLRDPNQVQGSRQITLELVSSTPHHPVQQDPTSGTRVTYVFTARMTPA